MNETSFGQGLTVHQISEIEDRHLAASESSDLRPVLVDAGDLVTQFRQTGAGYKSDVTGADDDDIHDGETFCNHCGADSAASAAPIIKAGRR